MSADAPAGETILIVDDEDSVRRTFLGWLEEANLGCRILGAADAESALRLAENNPVDLAILDWNLGAGSDGLQLLEDLTLFHPDVVAILVTGFAAQATPLDAMRMGVRDYLDKNHDLNPTTFLNAVRKQLGRIRPARRERRIHQGLRAFRTAVEQVLPLVQASAALHDPVPLPEAVRHLFRFLLRTTGGRDGVLLARSYDPAREPAEIFKVYDDAGQPVEAPLVPFARSVAGSVVSLGQPSAMLHPDQAAAGGSLELQPFERGRRSLLAAPLSVSPGLQVVLELFDKPGGFTEADRQLAAATADFGAEMLRQALAERQMHRGLFAAVQEALAVGDAVANSLSGGDPPHRREARPEDPTPPSVLEKLRQGLGADGGAGFDPEATLRLAEAIRLLGLRYGPAALDHCTRMMEGVRRLLDEATGTEEARP